jgi:hypothetical protein
MMINKISFKPQYIETAFDFSRNPLLNLLSESKEHLTEIIQLKSG